MDDYQTTLGLHRRMWLWMARQVGRIQTSLAYMAVLLAMIVVSLIVLAIRQHMTDRRLDQHIQQGEPYESSTERPGRASGCCSP